MLACLSYASCLAHECKAYPIPAQMLILADENFPLPAVQAMRADGGMIGMRAMDTVSARRMIQALADGLDPTTGERLAPGSPIESPEVIRALHAAVSALDRQIARSEREVAAPGNAGKAWSPEADAVLAEEFDAGVRIAEIARRFGRTEESIASRLVRIGKAPDRWTARGGPRRPPPDGRPPTS